MANLKHLFFEKNSSVLVDHEAPKKLVIIQGASVSSLSVAATISASMYPSAAIYDEISEFQKLPRTDIQMMLDSENLDE